MKNLNPTIDKVVTSLIDQVINNDKFHWSKMWKNIATGASPWNPIGGNQYSGFNKFILQLYASIKGCNQFATFYQISNAKGQVLKGSKSIPITKFAFYYTDANGKKYYDVKKIPAGLDVTKHPFWKTHLVFSISDTTLSFEEPKIEVKNNPIAECEKIVKNWECKINIGLDNERAYYAPSQDIINMPHLQAFENSNAFYSVAFHEIAHSTGAKNRLNRDMSGMFGNDKYAKEELVAELTSVMLSAKLNILTDELSKNATAYLQSWSKRMTDKKAELYQGLNHAYKAFQYITDKIS